MSWLALVIWGFLASVAAARIAGSIWPFELITHFTPHLTLLALGLAGMAAWAGSWPGAAASLAACVLAASGLLGVKTAPLLGSDRPGLTVVWANVWKSQAAADRTLDFARVQGAGVVIFGESPYDGAALAAAGGLDYPYAYALMQGIPNLRSKITVLSRYPLQDAAVLSPPDNDLRPMIELAVDVGGESVRIGAVHAYVPAHSRRLIQRDLNIAFAAGRVRGQYLLIGDFNATMWTPAMRGSGLTRAGHPLTESTWITDWPLLGLAIDHAFLGDGLIASHYQVGPFLGSDHRALVLRVHPR